MSKQEISESKKDTFVSIGASLAGIFMVIAILFLIFSPGNLGLLIPMVWAFVVLGIAMGFFAYKSRRQK